MRKDIINNAVEDIDDSFLAEASDYRPAHSSRKSIPFAKFAAVAACGVLAVGGGAFVITHGLSAGMPVSYSGTASNNTSSTEESSCEWIRPEDYYEHAPLSYIRDNSEEYIAEIKAMDTHNMVFHGDFGFDVPEKIGTYYKIERWDFNNYAEDVFRCLVPEGSFDEKNITEFEYDPLKIPEDNDPYYYVDEKNNLLAITAENGYFFYEDGTLPLERSDNSTELYKTVYLDEEYEDETLELIGGTAKMSELIDIAQKKLDEVFTVTNSATTVKPRWMYIFFDTVNKKYFCQIDFDTVYNEVAIFTPFEDGIYSFKPFGRDGASVYFTSPDRPARIFNNRILKDWRGASSQELDEIITPTAATQIMSDYLQSRVDNYVGYNVDDIRLTYLVLNDTSTVLVPYWQFVMITDSGESQSLFVNAIVGQIETIL
ncbi:MAG: hypothetical protein J1E39_04990 [Eubacterium sp.]|nr:hypothetical protein [Eubacterium sp.]